MLKKVIKLSSILIVIALILIGLNHNAQLNYISEKSAPNILDYIGLLWFVVTLVYLACAATIGLIRYRLKFGTWR